MQVVFHFDACRIDQNGQYVRDSILVLKVAHSYTRIEQTDSLVQNLQAEASKICMPELVLVRLAHDSAHIRQHSEG